MDKDIPITFEHKGRTYSGYFSRVSGGGSNAIYHLIIGHHYRGKLSYNSTQKQWRFTSNSGEFDELSEYFEAFLTGWFQ